MSPPEKEKNMAAYQNTPKNRQQRRAEAKINAERLRKEEAAKQAALEAKIAKNPAKKAKIEKKHKSYSTKKVLIGFVCVMLVFFIILGFVLAPALQW
jgi:Fe2+ transport system protein B